MLLAFCHPGYNQSSLPARLLLIVGTLFTLASCVTAPSREQLLMEPAPHLSDRAPSDIRDSRPEFRRLFCNAMEEIHPQTQSGGCESWLFRFPDEAGAARLMLPSQPMSAQVLVIPGAFSECFGMGARPFGDAPDLLLTDQLHITVVPVDGRSGTEHNAGQLAAFLTERQYDHDAPLIIIGYSKGTSDALQFLVDYPELATRVSALVSVAGSVRGSPLADSFGTLYDLLFSYLPSGHCERGDREVVDSLRTDVRTTWLSKNPLPPHVRYYSLAAFTDRERLARSLVAPWRLLLREGFRNDGQLLPEDALIPNSTLLAYLHADHWGVVMELEKELPMLLHREDPTTFPHQALLQAIIQQVLIDLEQTD